MFADKMTKMINLERGQVFVANPSTILNSNDPKPTRYYYVYEKNDCFITFFPFTSKANKDIKYNFEVGAISNGNINSFIQPFDFIVRELNQIENILVRLIKHENHQNIHQILNKKISKNNS